MFNFFKRPDTVSAKDFLKISDDVFVLDVRERDEPTKKEEALFKNYLLLPLSTLAESYTKLDKNTHYYILCRSGNRASKAYYFLNNLGYKVTVIAGGMLDLKKFI